MESEKEKEDDHLLTYLHTPPECVLQCNCTFPGREIIARLRLGKFWRYLFKTLTQLWAKVPLQQGNFTCRLSTARWLLVLFVSFILSRRCRSCAPCRVQRGGNVEGDAMATQVLSGLGRKAEGE